MISHVFEASTEDGNGFVVIMNLSAEAIVFIFTSELLTFKTFKNNLNTFSRLRQLRFNRNTRLYPACLQNYRGVMLRFQQTFNNFTMIRKFSNWYLYTILINLIILFKIYFLGFLLKIYYFLFGRCHCKSFG